MLGNAGTQGFRKAIQRRLLHREVDQFFLTNHLTRHIAGIAQRIDQAQLQGLLARPDQTRKQLWMLGILQALTAPLLDAGNKLSMSSLQNTLPELGLFGLLRLERVEKRLVLAGD